MPARQQLVVFICYIMVYKLLTQQNKHFTLVGIVTIQSCDHELEHCIVTAVLFGHIGINILLVRGSQRSNTQAQQCVRFYLPFY